MSVMEAVAPRFLADREKLRERVVTDMFTVALKSIELAQVRELFQEEIESAREIYDRFELAPEESVRKLKKKLVRLCFYFEGAISLACSVFDVSARITSTVLYFTAGVELESSTFERQLESKQILKLDGKLGNFLAEVAPAFDELRRERDSLSYTMASIVNLLDREEDLKDVLRKLPSVTGKLSMKIDSAQKLVTSYLRFMDGHLAKKI